MLAIKLVKLSVILSTNSKLLKSIYLILDSCYGIACNVTNEECLNGACGCFGGASCSGNINTPVCDPSSKACGGELFEIQKLNKAVILIQ